MRRIYSVKNLLAQFGSISRAAKKIGWPAAIRLFFCDLQRRAGITRQTELRLKNISSPLVMRVGSSDREVLTQIFIQGAYEPIELSQPRIIFDLGANVGYSAAYFLSRYPTAKVLAVEPDPNNYAVCCRNLKPFGHRAKVIHGGAWPECTQLQLAVGLYRDGREWATRVVPASDSAIGSVQVNGYDIRTLIGMCDCHGIDLLKIDIEKSELELFSRNTESWLPQVKNLCIELHDSDCEKLFFQALSAYSYDLDHCGELVFCRNLQIR
jgi:FkbM family methyltransferase